MERNAPSIIEAVDVGGLADEVEIFMGQLIGATRTAPLELVVEEVGGDGQRPGVGAAPLAHTRLMPVAMRRTPLRPEDGMRHTRVAGRVVREWCRRCCSCAPCADLRGVRAPRRTALVALG